MVEGCLLLHGNVVVHSISFYGDAQRKRFVNLDPIQV